MPKTRATARKPSSKRAKLGGTLPETTESYLSDDDIYLFNEGNHFRLYEKLGSRLHQAQGQQGAHFAVWAPDARSVHVVGDFNGWGNTAHPLRPRDRSGTWGGFIAGVGKGSLYKHNAAS